MTMHAPPDAAAPAALFGGPAGNATAPELKLRQFAPLDARTRAQLARMLRSRVQRVAANVPLIEAGETPPEIFVVLEGWACSRRESADAPGQVVALHLPGDTCDFSSLLKRRMDCTLLALTDLKVASLSRGMLAELTVAYPALSRAFWWDAMGAAAIRGEWIARMARRSARAKLSGLFCELAVRLYAVGLASDRGFDLPITQGDLGRCCGLTTEHTNRTLRSLREDGIASLENGFLTLQDWDRLRLRGAFVPDYLHFRDLKDEEIDIVVPTS